MRMTRHNAAIREISNTKLAPGGGKTSRGALFIPKRARDGGLRRQFGRSCVRRLHLRKANSPADRGDGRIRE